MKIGEKTNLWARFLENTSLTSGSDKNSLNKNTFVDKKNQNTLEIRLEEMATKTGRVITEEENQAVSRFMENQSGKTEKKWETIGIAIEKNIPLTEKNLKALHQTLNEKQNIGEMVETLAGKEGEATEKEPWEKRLDSVLKRYEKVVGSKGRQSISLSEEKLLKQIENIVKVTVEKKGDFVFFTSGEKNTVISIDALIENWSFALKSLEENSMNSKEANPFLAESLGVFTSDEKKENSIIEPVQDKSVNEVEIEEDWLSQFGERLDQSMNGVMEALQNQSVSFDDFDQDDTTQNRFRTFLKTEVTSQAHRAHNFFQGERKEILKNLEKNFDLQNPEHERVSLSRTIEKIDRLITSNEMSLFLDMKMEKKCLEMSSSLQKARHHLDKGEGKKAFDIVNAVKKDLKSLSFSPSEKTIELRAFQKGLTVLGISKPAAFLQTETLHSARNVLSYFRHMGLNHEAEWAEKILSSGGKPQFSKRDDGKDNMKAILLRMEQNQKAEDVKKIEMVQKQLNHLGGQQLFNKLEPSKDVQNLFFHIPIQSAEQVKDMKLFVQGRKKGEQMDWENCSLYFSIDLKHYGNTGIYLQVQDRLISVRVKNDHPQAQKALEPIMQGLKKDFSPVGFSWGPVHFQRFDEKNPLAQTKENKFSQDNANMMGKKNFKQVGKQKKGFDQSI